MAKTNVNRASTYNRYPNNKNKKNKKKSNNWLFILLGAVLVVAIVLIIVFSTGSGTKQNSNGDLVIPLSEISKNVKIYKATVDGVKMEILVAYTSSGELRTAFNTCQVCYDSGRGYYKANGNTVTCQNCRYTYTVDEFNTSKEGGCKPWAITASERTTTSDTLTIPVSVLRANKNLFQ